MCVGSVSMGGCMRVGECYFWGACGGGRVRVLFTPYSLDIHSVSPILPNPGLQLPGGAENCNSAPNCHFRARFDSRGEVV